jgi:hypothetical protein
LARVRSTRRAGRVASLARVQGSSRTAGHAMQGCGSRPQKVARDDNGSRPRFGAADRDGRAACRVHAAASCRLRAGPASGLLATAPATCLHTRPPAHPSHQPGRTQTAPPGVGAAQQRAARCLVAPRATARGPLRQRNVTLPRSSRPTTGPCFGRTRRPASSASGPSGRPGPFKRSAAALTHRSRHQGPPARRSSYSFHGQPSIAFPAPWPSTASAPSCCAFMLRLHAAPSCCAFMLRLHAGSAAPRRLHAAGSAAPACGPGAAAE